MYSLFLPKIIVYNEMNNSIWVFPLAKHHLLLANAIVWVPGRLFASLYCGIGLALIAATTQSLV